MYNIFEELLKEHDVTPYRVAKETGVTTATFTSWKQGKYTPKQDKLQKIADYFDVSVEYLLGKTAFRKPMELFENWSGHNDPYFEAPFDFGKLLMRERENQGITQQEVSKALHITESDVDGIEEGTLPLNYELAQKYANFLDTSVQQIFIDNDMDDSLNDIPLELLQHYQEQGMNESEMAISYAKHRQDQPYYALNGKDERDIAKMLEEMMEGLSSGNQAFSFMGEPMEDEDRELLRISLENTLRMSKQMAKKKFTPKKYRDEE
jgi:transcriptional regulator with XRE-family HTH domain